MNLEEVIKPYTELSPERISILIDLANRALSVPGDLVECGVMNGGSAAILAYYAKQGNRKTWLFDSFQGLPSVTKEDTPSLWGSYMQHVPYSEAIPCPHHGICENLSHFYLVKMPHPAEKEVGKCEGSVEKVKEILSLVGANMSEVEIVQGWFQETFPTVNITQIAMLNLDSDWYESEKLCLNKFYDSVSPGGYVYFDDFYFWPGCRKAVTEFFESRGEQPVFNQVFHSAWIQKGGL